MLKAGTYYVYFSYIIIGLGFNLFLQLFYANWLVFFIRARRTRISIKHTRPGHVPFEAGRHSVFNPNKAGNCSAYATRIAETFFGKSFVRADAWELGLRNRIVSKAAFDRKTRKGGFSKQRLAGLIKSKKITPGTIIGVFYPNSVHNKPGRAFTHVMVFVGKNTFWHNYSGPKKISLDEIFSVVNKKGERLFFPVQLIEPK